MNTDTVLKLISPVIPLDSSGNPRTDIWDYKVNGPISLDDSPVINITIYFGKDKPTQIWTCEIVIAQPAFVHMLKDIP